MMTTIRELLISSIGEPAHIKLEKNSKGYNYELSLYGDCLEQVEAQIFASRKRIEAELGTSQAVQA